MHAKELLTYRYDNTLMTIDPVEKIKVADVADADEDGD